MDLYLAPLPTALGLFAAMLLAIESGRRLGVARIERDPDQLTKGVGAAEGAVFALLGLILAFTFSGAASRFQERRHLITEEVNAIGTAWLRLDLLPASAQGELRDLFRRYLDARLAAYAAASDEAAYAPRLAESVEVQGRIWTAATAAARAPDAPPSAPMLLLPALNAMFDIATTRLLAARDHPPIVVFLMLGALSLLSSVLIGFSSAQNPRRRLLHTLGFALIMSLTVYLILELEYPRKGLVRVDSADRALVELRASMQ